MLFCDKAYPVIHVDSIYDIKVIVKKSLSDLILFYVYNADDIKIPSSFINF